MACSRDWSPRLPSDASPHGQGGPLAASQEGQLGQAVPLTGASQHGGGPPDASQEGQPRGMPSEAVATQTCQPRVLVYNVGVGQSGAKTGLDKLKDDVRKITNSCEVALLQQVNQYWHTEIRWALPCGAPGRVSWAGASDQG